MQVAISIERLARCLFVVQVAHDDLRAFGQDLAWFANATFRAIVFHDLDRGAGNDGPDCVRVLVVVQTGRVGCDAGAGLCHSIALLEASLRELLLEKLDDLLAQRCSATRETAQEAKIVFVDNRVAYEADQDWRHEEEFLDLVFDDCV